MHCPLYIFAHNNLELEANKKQVFRNLHVLN